MLDVMPRELASGLWCWTAPHPDWRPDRGGVGGWDRNVGSWLLEEDARVVLIDPLLPDDHSLLCRLDERIGGRTVDVLITCTGHLRSAEAVQERYGATVWGNAKTREDVEQLVTGLIVDGVSLPAGIIPYTPIPNDAKEDETAFWLPPQQALAVGDILIHTPEGLRIWWEQNTEALRAEYRERVSTRPPAAARVTGRAHPGASWSADHDQRPAGAPASTRSRHLAAPVNCSMPQSFVSPHGAINKQTCANSSDQPRALTLAKSHALHRV
jgi:glyoxylase-like metal-dependent hydrolase (beta-lactamase superfamily II)